MDATFYLYEVRQVLLSVVQFVCVYIKNSFIVNEKALLHFSHYNSHGYFIPHTIIKLPIFKKTRELYQHFLGIFE